MGNGNFAFESCKRSAKRLIQIMGGICQRPHQRRIHPVFYAHADGFIAGRFDMQHISPVGGQSQAGFGTGQFFKSCNLRIESHFRRQKNDILLLRGNQDWQTPP